MLAWWRVFGDTGERRLRTVAFYEGPRLVGLAPLVSRPFVHRPRLRFQRLETLASGEEEADETCSVYLGLIAARGLEQRVASSFVGALGRFGAWDELVLPSLDAESKLVSYLEGELEQQRLQVEIAAQDIAPFVPLPRTFDDYLGQLDEPRRTQLRGWLDALERWLGGRPALVRARTGAELAEARRILEALHREHHPDGGVYRSERFRRFHAELMPELLALGALDAGWLPGRDGKPIAAFYNFRWNGRAWHYQSGHARSVPDDVRIGVTLQALLVRAAIEDGLREYDFLAGALDYKLALSLEERRLVTLRAARPSLVEAGRRVTSLLRLVGRAMRHRA